MQYKFTQRHARTQDLTGQSFGAWTVLQYAGSDGKRVYWTAECICGTVRDVLGSELRERSLASPICHGHWTSRRQAKTHGLSQTPEYHAWWNMLNRCENPKAQEYHRYGARGVTVCDAWHDFLPFYADMGPRPSARHSIDRYPDPHGNYGPENCRWATPAEQNRNMRSNIMRTYEGETQCLKDWAIAKGQDDGTLYQRIKNEWPLHEALTLPSQRGKKTLPFRTKDR